MELYVGQSHTELRLKAQVVAKYANILLTITQSESGDDAILKGCTGGNDLPAGRCAALRYLASHGSNHVYPRPPFAGKALQTAATIDSWIEYSANAIVASTLAWRTAGSAKDADATLQQLQSAIAVLDVHLADRTFVAGNSLSLADIVLAVDLLPAFAKILGPSSRQALPHATRWFQTTASQPAFTESVGVPHLAATASEPPGIASSASRAAAGKAASEKKKAERLAAAKDSKSAAAAGGVAGAAGVVAASAAGTSKKPKGGKAAKASASKPTKFDGTKRVNEDGMTVTKSADFARWYQEVVVKSEMIEYYDVSGCYILRPYAMDIWDDGIREWFSAKIKPRGVKKCYFPLFITKGALEREADHVEGFAAEVAWVTKSGKTDLQEPLAIRPTSETAMYPFYAKWIRSHRDLPLKLNQWNAVIRWEFKHPTPFIRSREFLWQEGHSAFATREEAAQDTLEILDLYAEMYEQRLAVPVCKGVKSAKEKFAGADFTTTVEAFIPGTGRGIQGGTSHMLGQNFSKMFGIQVEQKDGNKEYVWQNSWGITTRSIGVAIMIHGDDKGMVMPPRVAPVQLVGISIPNAKLSAQERTDLVNKVGQLCRAVGDVGVRVEVDTEDHHSPGWKYNYWELKGVPIRMEVGPRDIAGGTVVLARRDNGTKKTVAWANLTNAVPDLLEQIQADMLERASLQFAACVERTNTWDEFMAALGRGHMALAPWCDEEAVEDDIKRRSVVVEASGEKAMGAKTLCHPATVDRMPIESLEMPEGTLCFASGKPAKKFVLLGRSY